MLRHQIARLLPALLLIPVAASRGGWATVTLDDLPDRLVVGQPLTLSFMVRQHGVTPMKGIHPTIEAQSGGNTVRANAEPGNETGRYVAVLSVKQAGDWVITINSGWGTSKLTLLPIPAVAAPSTAAPEAEYQRGRRLFVGKGCVGCHTRDEGDLQGGETIGPLLTGKRYQGEWLRKFLADPAANATNTGSFRMPNLGLKPAEISALVAYLNGERGRAQ